MTARSPASHARAALTATAAVLLASMSACAWIAGLEDHHLAQTAPDAASDGPADVSLPPDGDASDASAEDAADATSDPAVEPVHEAGLETGDARDADAEGEGEAEASAPVTMVFTIQADQDDAMWLQCTQAPSDERLFFSSTEHVICVSDDQDDECAALRFNLAAIPKGAKIQSALLTLTKVNGVVDGTQAIQVRVWDSPATPPFDETHAELAANHDPATLWAGGVVQDWAPPWDNIATTSPELATLVQRVVDHADWGTKGTHVAFMLQRQSIPATYCCFSDFSSGISPGSLEVTWVPAP